MATTAYVRTNVNREEEQAVVRYKSSGCTFAETIQSTLTEYLSAHPIL